MNTPEYTSVGGSPYIVLVNGVQDGGTHTTWHKAAQHADALEIEDPSRDVEIARSEHYKVEDKTPLIDLPVGTTAEFQIVASDPTRVNIDGLKVTMLSEGPTVSLTLVRLA